MSRFVRGSGALTARASGPTPWRAASASAVGSLLEHYDFFLYAPLATLVFAKIFFPGQSDGAGLLLSLGTFAVGFLSRPLGGVLAGHLGDRLGRKRLLVATFLVTGSVTCAIGLLPTYAQIGPWAPVLLVALRFVQGIGMGGEWAGAALLAVEHAPHGRRGLFGSVAQAGAPLGIMVANGAVAVVMATLSPRSCSTGAGASPSCSVPYCSRLAWSCGSGCTRARSSRASGRAGSAPGDPLRRWCATARNRFLP